MAIPCLLIYPSSITLRVSRSRSRGKKNQGVDHSLPFLCLTSTFSLRVGVRIVQVKVRVCERRELAIPCPLFSPPVSTLNTEHFSTISMQLYVALRCPLYYTLQVMNREKVFVKRIGIFDSGAGGLTVLKELRNALPGVKYYYLGDTARLPYGTKSSETIIRYTKQNVSFLLTKGIDVLIVACNTASAYAIPALREYAGNIPVTGVIHPGARRAVDATENGRIGIIGTQATISSDKYQKKLIELNPDLKVFSAPAPLLVPLVEEGLISGEIPEKVISMYLEPLLEENIDTLILGCTHYPILKQTIREMYPALCLVDSAEPIRDILLKEYRFPNRNGKTEIYVTDYPEGFGLLSQRFLEGNFDKIEHIDLQKLWRPHYEKKSK